MKKINIILISLFCLYTSPLFSQTTNIYFGNGIANTPEEATFSSLALRHAFFMKMIKQYPDTKFNFLVSYNASRGFVKDVLEVINQKVDETGGLTATEILFLMKLSKKAVLSSIKALSTASGGGRIIVDVALNAVDRASDHYLEMLQKDSTGLSKYYEQETQNKHINEYISVLENETKVVIIAHSQGNLFANNSLETIFNKKPSYIDNIGIVGVGNPAGKIINNNEYITANDDLVINALSIAYSVLPSNIDNDPGVLFDPRGYLNHSFTRSYLASELHGDYKNKTLASRSKIDNMFFGALSRLSYPNEAEPQLSTSKVLKTGQTKCYDYDTNEEEVCTEEHKGQDGYYAIIKNVGVDRSYTSMSDNNGTHVGVRDNVTKLMWQDNEDVKNVTKTLEEAKTYCSNEVILGGYNDWRLPTIEELQLLLDSSKIEPSIDSKFQNILHSDTIVNNYHNYDFYLSSSLDLSNDSKAWCVEFNKGFSSSYTKTNNYYVRCVRGVE